MFHKFTFIFSYLSFYFTIVINSSWLISRFINAWHIKVSMLFNSLVGSARIYYVPSYVFLVICKTFFIIPAFKENTRVKLALAISAEAPITLAKEIIDTTLIVADKTILSI